jgi:diaminohydroxyphosphoribosylaminopyrimidine deaminase/5-amino-6-(5-phosphoribosylamino)uracil reductase
MQSAQLIRAFKKATLKGLPWVVLKSAHRFDDISVREGAIQKGGRFFSDLPSLKASMTPPEGLKTFTSSASLRDAHQLRRDSDVILTGSGTILIDQPSFTVRLVSDHPDRRRTLVVLDRRRRISQEWGGAASSRGLDVLIPPESQSVESVLESLVKQGALQVLVEAGPEVSHLFLSSGLVDEHVAYFTAPNSDDVRVVWTRYDDEPQGEST